MQTYFADLLAFFGISGAPQTFAELTILCRSWIICKNPLMRMICSPKQKFLLIRLHLLPLAWMLLLPVEKPKRL